LDEKLELRPFLMQVFGPHVDPFLDIQMPRLDAPFVYVTLTATTPWQEKPRTLNHAAFLPTLAGETDNYGVIYLISRATYANVNAVCAPLARAVKKVHPYMRLLSHPHKLERRRLDVLTGLIVGDETCDFMFPSQTARSASSHVIAVSMWPQDPVGAYNLDELQPYPIPLTIVLDVRERSLPAIAEQARKAIYNWLQYHPLAIPRQRDTGMMTVARNKGISLTPSPAAFRQFLTPPKPPPRLLAGGSVVGAPFLKGGPASSPLGSLTGSGMASSRSTTHIPHA
jgi:hypothetical protein